MMKQKDLGIREKVHKRRRLKKNVKILVCLMAIIAAVYFSGVLYFNYNYFFNTIIDGDDFSLKTVQQAEEFLQDKTNGYTLKIVAREGVEEIVSAEELEIKNVFDGSLQKIILEQNTFGWIFSVWSSNIYHIENLAEFNEEKLEQKLKQMKILDSGREPENAYIGEFSSSMMQYPMIEEDKGTVLLYQNVWNTVKAAVCMLEDEVNLEEAGCYKKPVITKDNPRLKKIISQLNGYVGTRIIYDWHGIEEIVDGNQIMDWLLVEGDKVEVDEEAVREYINVLSRKHDLFGQKRTFKTAVGEEIPIEGGAYGWRINRSEETEELLKLIREGAAAEREPVYLYTAYQRGEDDIGNSYVEIDLSNQHLYLFIDGEMILETDFVSGNIARGYGTPTGIYGLTYKERNVTLKGENYASSVSYWMPFNGNIGMHDAGWRNKFGGQIYRTNGSHGCINLPKKNAETIYGYLEKNFPVICYNSKEEKKNEEGQDNDKDNKPEAGENTEQNAIPEAGQNPEQSITPEAGQNPDQSITPEAGQNPDQSITPEAGQNPDQSITPEAGQNPDQSITPEAGGNPE